MSPIYLDHAATTPCDPRVFEAMRSYSFERGGNASSPHAYGRQARKAIEQAREMLAESLGALPNEIFFNSGATEGNNHAVLLTARSLKNKGRHLIASGVEHHSVLEPLHQLVSEGFQVSLIAPDSTGIVSATKILEALRTETILVCLQHANNEIGTLQPVETVGAKCRELGIGFLVDATQTVGHLSVNVKSINCDLLTLSAHKFYGPQGVGALYIRQGFELPALILGGDQERGRRAGTLNCAGIVGLAEAIKICRSQMQEDSNKENFLQDLVIDTVLREIPGAMLNGHREKRLPNNAHFSFEGINGEELISAMDQAGIAVSMGSACTWGRLEPSHVLKSMGLSDAMSLSSLRVSTGRSTNEQDIVYFLEQLKRKVNILR